MREEWRDISGYEGLYMVSSDGKVKNVKTGRILKQSINPHGYAIVCLYKSAPVPVKETFHVHRLVAQAFVKQLSEDKTEITHKDGNKLNNSAENLMWVTPSERMSHAYAIGNKKPHRKTIPKKLTVKIVQEIRKRHREEGLSTYKLAEEYGISQSTTHKIIKRDIWKNI